jgi:hypothetical protein
MDGKLCLHSGIGVLGAQKDDSRRKVLKGVTVSEDR